MADNLKVLAQAFPGAGVLTDAYAVPAGVAASISSLVVANQGVVWTTFRIAVAVAGAADAPQQYLYYDAPLGPKRTFIATIGGTLGPADVLRVQSGNGALSFNAFGVEVS